MANLLGVQGNITAELELEDSRVDFLADFILKTLKLKPDKFGKMYALEENQKIFTDFFDKPEVHRLLAFLSSSGQLTVTYDWPMQLKTKACYFVKVKNEAITLETNMRKALFYGNLSQTPVDQLEGFVDEVSSHLIFCSEYCMKGGKQLKEENKIASIKLHLKLLPSFYLLIPLKRAWYNKIIFY